jgi:protein-S-isoprenylcysteine O-methyltransferase Ste14
LGAVVFLPAGSLKSWQGWVYVLGFLAFSLFFGVYFYRHDRGLLERRLQVKERERGQKIFKKLWLPLWFLTMTMPGLDYRFGWSRSVLAAVPLWLTVLSQALVLGSDFLMLGVFRFNSFASTVIQVEGGQKVVSAGPYRIVRHPMYSAILIMIVFTPLALGSYVTLPVALLLIPVLVLRLVNEEEFLVRELPGYAEYRVRTRFRLVPLVY